MEQFISRSEHKRRGKTLEELASELVNLSASEIKRLTCEDFLKEEIKSASGMSGGAKKRQTKYIAKCLRQTDCEPLFSFLDEKKGSKLKENKVFHELERLRDDIISEALIAMREAATRHEKLDSSWDSETIDVAAHQFPGIDKNSLKNTAIQYVRSRKPTFNRELFRLLKAARDQQQFGDDADTSGSQPEE
ncbi:MAG: DUF615 domain-containing protein [Proteobacteria bacterium]|nr:DUF615 domain-containing protein [Desulfobulbaceae bacterium]MBU4152874.1 DUF615 domain-containing protein [Pseudomonadota bacterium]MDP2106350.1 ribosome biogenesis factor YjgA [Desulfobulbaceae bacterium]